MFEEITRSNGRPLFWPFSLSVTRYSSALIASSPRTAYWTLRTAGLRESTVRDRMAVLVQGCVDGKKGDKGLNLADALIIGMNFLSCLE
jgi:hypothetical protein